jgi:type II secretory pathway pseudopilin PulG
MSTGIIVLLVILVVMIAALVALYFMGKKAQTRQEEQRAQMDAVAQQVSMLIIDKKRLKMKDSGLPEAVISATPWYAKNSKIPVVKAKVGPQMMTLICDAEIFDEMPVKKEVKATVSGLYITKVRGLRGGNATVDTKKKKGLRAWALNKRKELEAQNKDK